MNQSPEQTPVQPVPQPEKTSGCVACSARVAQNGLEAAIRLQREQQAFVNSLHGLEDKI